MSVKVLRAPAKSAIHKTGPIIDEVRKKFPQWLSNLVYEYAVSVDYEKQFTAAFKACDLNWVQKIECIYHIERIPDHMEYVEIMERLTKKACRVLRGVDSLSIVLWMVGRYRKYWSLVDSRGKLTRSQEKALVGGYEPTVPGEPLRWYPGACSDNVRLRKRLLEHFVRVERKNPMYNMTPKDLIGRYNFPAAFIDAAETGKMNTLRWCMRMQRQNPEILSLNYSLALRSTITSNNYIQTHQVRVFKLISLRYFPAEELWHTLDQITHNDKMYPESEYNSNRSFTEYKCSAPWRNALKAVTSTDERGWHFRLNYVFCDVEEHFAGSRDNSFEFPETKDSYIEAVCNLTRKRLEQDLGEDYFQKHYLPVSRIEDHLLVFREMIRLGCEEMDTACTKRLGITFENTGTG